MTIHQCELLQYEGRYLQLVYPGTEYQRWTLRVVNSGIPDPDGDKDTVYMQVVFFCPGCGMDCRGDCEWRIWGKPQFNSILERGQKAGAA